MKTSKLFLSKNADRAHTERVLEDMMGDDWRVFRAKLVAQEEAEARDLAAAAGSTPSVLVENAASDELLAGSLLINVAPELQLTSTTTKTDAPTVYIGERPAPIEDPFASEEELPLMMEPKIVMDKHRWAHPIGHIEPGCVLIANEKLGGVFHHAVVLIIDHNESSGSTGIVINRCVFMRCLSLVVTHIA